MTSAPVPRWLAASPRRPPDASLGFDADAGRSFGQLDHKVHCGVAGRTPGCAPGCAPGAGLGVARTGRTGGRHPPDLRVPRRPVFASLLHRGLRHLDCPWALVALVVVLGSLAVRPAVAVTAWPSVGAVVRARPVLDLALSRVFFATSPPHRWPCHQVPRLPATLVGSVREHSIVS